MTRGKYRSPWAAAVTAVFTAVALLGVPQAAQAAPATSTSQFTTVEVSTTTAAPGDPVTFTLTIDNTSGFDEDAAIFIGADANLFDVPGTCTVLVGAPPVDCEVFDAGSSVGLSAGELEDEESVKVVISTTVADDAPPGTHTLTPALGISGEDNTYTPTTLPFTVTGEADITVGLTATTTPLSGAISYAQTATNNGPSIATGGTVTTQLPAQTTSVTNLPGNCSYNGTAKTVACTLTNLADNATATNTFTARLGLLSLGPLPATATRTTSTPTDPNPANDSATTSCTVITGLIILC
ncbi:hypothetical protein [Streptomyces sp. NPDC014894]|uniref:hypothetical protein n=1 Tax=Streptomyces sp. NPDC014894 TaxID=3364931 RepID=UPI0037023921